MTAEIIKIAEKALETELFATAIYSYFAERYPEKTTSKTFAEMVEMEKWHSNFWTEFLKVRGVDKTMLKSSDFRLTLYKVMFRLIGKGLTLRMMETSENQAVELYSSIIEDSSLSAAERQSLGKILEDELVHEKLFLKEESKFEGVIAYIKDAVLGLNDGVVEILSVTTGLAGASGSPMIVAISGLVVTIAGGLSMGISIYSGSRAQRQVHEGILRRIASASKFVAHIFRERVSSHLENRGYSKRVAGDMAEESARDHRLLSRFIAEEEYGIREESLGNPVKASLYAGSANIVGSLIPLLPYFFTPDIFTALILSVVLAALALAVTGYLVAILGYMSPGKKIGEIVLSGLGAAAVTYVIGRAVAALLGTGHP